MFVVIGRNDCEFCKKAEHLLRDKRLGFVSYQVDSQSSRWLLTLIKQAGYTTVPQIFSPKGSHIGGFTDLKDYIDAGGAEII